MLVLCLTSCPPSLRGDITRWLLEIDAGVYAGNVSARVRDELWDRIIENVKDGRATLVYSARNEQKMEFRVHNTEWTPADFDGLTLMMRPKAGLKKATGGNAAKRSNAQAMLDARKYGRRKKEAQAPSTGYAVIDIETTGLSCASDRIIEIGALTVENGNVTDEYERLIKLDGHIPEKISKLTGITDEMLANDAVDEAAALGGLIAFIGDMSIVMHNAAFDLNFIAQACRRAGLDMPVRKVTDTVTLAKRTLDDVDDYKLATLAAYFSITPACVHRSLGDCITTKQVYEKLIEKH